MKAKFIPHFLRFTPALSLLSYLALHSVFSCMYPLALIFAKLIRKSVTRTKIRGLIFSVHSVHLHHVHITDSPDSIFFVKRGRTASHTYPGDTHANLSRLLAKLSWLTRKSAGDRPKGLRYEACVLVGAGSRGVCRSVCVVQRREGRSCS